MKHFTIFLLLFCTTSLLAQDYGSLGGRLTDEFSKDPICHAKLSLLIDGAIVAQTEAGHKGDFLFRDVTEGYYDLVIFKLGYSPLKITDLVIPPNQHIEFNPTFEGEGFDQDTMYYSYEEMQNIIPAPNSPTVFPARRRIHNKQQRAARRLDKIID